MTGDTNTLSASDPVKHEEISFARSSSLPSQSSWTNNGQPNELTFIPPAIDAAGVAEQGGYPYLVTAVDPATENNVTDDLSVPDVNAALATNSPSYTVPANSITQLQLEAANIAA